MEQLGNTTAFHKIRKNIEIVGGDVVTRHGFTQVPNFVLTNPKLSPGEKLSYAMLLKYAWSEKTCFPGQETLAKDMGVSLRSANSYIKGLEKLDLLEIKRRGLGKTNIYRLHIRVPKMNTRKCG